MRGLTRRIFIASAALSAGMTSRFASAGADIAIPASSKGGGMPLLEALSKRRSTRLFSDETIDEATLLTLLWCAFGINRPDSGYRTAPSWRSSMETDIYVADTGGVRKFDPSAEAMAPALNEDIRKKASLQPFVGTAPTVLIFVADRSRMADAPEPEQIQSAHVDAAIIAQNVYLYCASAGLGTCLVGGADKPGLKALLRLPDTQLVTFVQPVGYPQTN